MLGQIKSVGEVVGCIEAWEDMIAVGWIDILHVLPDVYQYGLQNLLENSILET